MVTKHAMVITLEINIKNLYLYIIINKYSFFFTLSLIA